MDIYRRFSKYTPSTVNGVAFPPKNKGFAVSTVTSTGLTVDAFTYTASGATESNRMWFTTGTYVLPVTVSGISCSSSASSTEFVVMY
jgi:hypothetical protein